MYLLSDLECDMLNSMPDAPESWWGTDLIDQDITLDAEAQQVLLFQLQAHPEICRNELQRQFLLTRDADHVHVRVGGLRSISVILDPRAAEEEVFGDERRITPDQVAHILNSIPRTYRARLAEGLRRTEEAEHRETVLMLYGIDESYFPHAKAAACAEEMIMGMQVLQAEAIGALILGEL